MIITLPAKPKRVIPDFPDSRLTVRNVAIRKKARFTGRIFDLLRIFKTAFSFVSEKFKRGQM